MASSAYKCTNCGETFPKWNGQCQSCGEWNTLVESENITKKGGTASVLQKISEVSSESLERISTGFTEFDRVLGSNPKEKSGVAKGSVALLSGDPGIGKSTLLLQVSANIASVVDNVIYVSAEESVSQIALRAKRLGLDKKLESVDFIHDSDVDAIITSLQENDTKFAIIDSIQTIFTSDVSGMPGGIAQVKAAATRLIRFAKKEGVTMFIIGHINKEGSIAGPKILEHLVDSVIQIEGDKETELRIVRGLKNRFGATNEVGILKMDENGLEDVTNPSSYFLSEDNLPGVCRGLVSEGNRTLVIEVQSLISPTIFSLPKRVSEGISLSRLQMICAILQKYLKVNLSDKDIYVNIAGGIKIMDRGLDLAIALSILSSFKNQSLGKDTVMLGELALTGTVNKTFGEANKLKEAKRLGYKVVGSSTLNNISKSWSLLK